MGQLLLVYCLSRGSSTAMMIFYKNTKAMVALFDGDTDSNRVLKRDILLPYIFINCLVHVRETSIDRIKENSFSFKINIKQTRSYRNNS